MRKSARYVLLGLLFYLLFLVATFPAGWIAEAATRLSNGQVTLAAARGTFWSGSGELYTGSSASGPRSLGTLNWSVNPLWLFALRAQLAAQLDGPTARG